MRFALFLTLALSCVSICQAQSPAAAPAAADPQKTSAATASGAIEKRTERIHVEDAGARIDELRIGGETKTIDVQPKGGMPAYQVAPTSGERSWKILGF
ncbi:hypothetical protein [Rhodoferax sp. UBA5149]|uniref:hypothetical protein n=1 Tax=Rhodoferax sp. UBA5149 TaxID=1947379 RepID=UPI0025CF3B64|nr:hypothetical protein [Rhodoferax sp. UBA5149]